jgi:nitric oxide reductase subunit C
MSSDKRKLTIFLLLAIAFLSYSFYIYSALPVANYGSSNESRKGKMIWQQYNCNACHQVYGLGGYLGPDLTNVYSLRGPAYINAFLSTGTVSMPNFQLTTEEKNNLIHWLKEIDSSGSSDLKTFRINYDGSIEQ